MATLLTVIYCLYSMSVYHSIRTVLPDPDDDDILLDLGLESILHPAAERSPAHVSLFFIYLIGDNRTLYVT